VRGEARSAPRPGAVQFLGRGELLRRLVVGEHGEALPRGVVAPGAGVVEVAEPVVAASRNRWNVTGSGTPEKSHSAYLCAVAGGSSLVGPWYDSSSVVAARFLAAGAWRPGRPSRAATSALADEACAIAAPRKPRRNRGPETTRSPIGAVAVMPVIASHCEAMRAARCRSIRACREC
jgi:hypothetical protein